MTKFEEELKETYEKVSINLYGNNAGSIGMKKLLNELKDTGLLKEQQALPVVPECVAEFITKVKKADNNLTFAFNSKFDECPAKYWNEAIVWRLNHPEEFALAFITGKYEVEKPQLFEVKMPIVYWDDDASQLTNGFEFLRIDKETDEVDFIGFLSNTKKHTVYFTEQEIKSIDERYWQFAVPVEEEK